MATIRPYRTYWDAVAVHWVYFNAVLGTKVVHDEDTLAITQDNVDPTGDLLFAGIEFDTNTAPSWVTDGPVAAFQMGLMITQMQGNAKTAGPSLVAMGPATGSWDQTYTAAQMRAVVGGFSNCSFFDEEVQGSPQIWTRGQSLTTNFYIVKLNSVNQNDGGCLRLSTNPAPVLRFFYQYSITGATRGDATTRITYTDAITAILAGKKEYRKFELEIISKQSDIRPTISDETLAVIKGTQLPVQSRAMSFPETWKLDIPAAGSVPVSLVTNTLDDIQGMPVETKLKLIERDGTETVLAESRQTVGDVTFMNDGTAEIELRSMLAEVFAAAFVNCSPYITPTVNYVTERPMYILADVLLNATGLGYQQFHYNNLVRLSVRFAAVWDNLTCTQSASPAATQISVRDLSTGDLIEKLAVLYNLCMSQSADGCIDLWHPAEYRDSMRVWTIDEDDCLPGGYKMIKRGMDTQYGTIRVSDENTTVGTQLVSTIVHAGRGSGYEVGHKSLATTGSKLVNLPNFFPSQPGFIEREYSVSLSSETFLGTSTGGDEAKQAIGRQILQKLGGRLWQCELSLGLKGLPIDIGDVIKLTGTGLDATTRFLVIAVSPDVASGTAGITGAYYPEALSMSNTFEDVAEIHGIWRWLDETGTQDTSNMAITATDPVPSTCTLSSIQNWHWQGAIWEDDYVEWSVPLFTAGKHDVIEMIAIAKISNVNAVANYASWGDQDYMPLMVWKKASGDERMVLGMKRMPDAASASGMLNYLFFGIVDDYTADPFTFTTATIITAPGGIIGREAYANAPSVAVALSVQLDDSGNVTVYADRQEIMSGTGYAKADWTELRITTQVMWDVGAVKHIQTTTAITETQRLFGMNGLDDYIP